MDIQNSPQGNISEEIESAFDISQTRADKWLLSSALQKLVRQGRTVQSIAIAKRLHQVDDAYLRRRLPIIGLEDIGAANLELCQEITTICSSKKWWGEEASNTIHHMVCDMAESVKSRAACDAYCLAEAHPDRNIVLPALLRCTPYALVEIASNPECAQLNRLTALRVLGGITLGDGTYRRLSKFNAKALDQVCQILGVPENVRWLVARNAKTSGMAAMLPFVWGMMDGAVVSAGQEFPHSMEMIGGLPLCALDKYTRSGKVALQRWYVGSDALQDFVCQYAPRSRPMPLINMAMFQTESCELDRSLTNSDLEDLKTTTDEAELLALGLVDAAHRLPLYRLLSGSAGTLRQHRVDCLHMELGRQHDH